MMKIIMKDVISMVETVAVTMSKHSTAVLANVQNQHVDLPNGKEMHIVMMKITTQDVIGMVEIVVELMLTPITVKHVNVQTQIRVPLHQLHLHHHLLAHLHLQESVVRTSTIFIRMLQTYFVTIIFVKNVIFLVIYLIIIIFSQLKHLCQPSCKMLHWGELLEVKKHPL